MEYILALEGVCKSYPKSQFALEDISFSIPYGSIMGFVGENGAGKTTTIGCILNTLRMDKGRVKLFGKEMQDGDTELREKIGVVYDGENFPTYLTAERLSRIFQGIYQSWDQPLFEAYLEKFHLPRALKIKGYSRGMTMKLALSAALSHHPCLLILDEATGGLDPIMRDEMLDVFLDFVQEEDHSILLSSHITTDLEKIADAITFIHEGKLLLTAPKDELLYRYGVLRCGESHFSAIEPQDILAYRKRDFQMDLLVADREKAAKKYKGMVVDPASVEEIMLLLGKGNRI